jgi:hypothetical protein
MIVTFESKPGQYNPGPGLTGPTAFIPVIFKLKSDFWPRKKKIYPNLACPSTRLLRCSER